MNQEVIVYVLSLCYGIWYARNKLCFEGKFIHLVDIVCKACTIIDEHKMMINVDVASWRIINVLHDSDESEPQVLILCSSLRMILGFEILWLRVYC
jgi:hypothetical protein